MTLLGEAFSSGVAPDKGLHNSDRFYHNFYSPGAYYQCYSEQFLLAENEVFLSVIQAAFS